MDHLKAPPAVGYDRIWAPWRLAYIEGCDAPEADQQPPLLLPGADRDCFLCRAAAADGDERARGVIHRSDHCLVVLNRYPYNNGHLLVAPRLHLARLDQLNDQTQLELSQTIARMLRLLENALHPEGFNVGLNLGRAAGAGLPNHLHWHIVPRWNGDTNFMPTLAAVKVIPQSLEALWELLTNRTTCERPSVPPAGQVPE